MFRIFVWTTILLAGTVPALAEETAKSQTSSATAAAIEPGLTSGERAEVVQMLEKSRTELEALVARVGDDRWVQRADAEKWSVGEVVEHLVLAEEGLMAMAKGALQGEPDPEWKKIAQAGVDNLLNTIQDRSQKFQAPETLEPKAEASRQDMLARFASVRAQTLDFVLSTQAPLKQHTAAGPPGKMNVHQWLVLIAGHNLRHNRQIAEVIDGLS